MGATRRRSGEDNQAQCEPRWPRLDSTDTLRGCTLTRSCAAPCAIRSGTAKRASNKETLTVAGSRIPVIPQLTADTMRHRRTTNVPFPMGKNEENREIRGFWFAGSAGRTLERPPMPRRAPKWPLQVDLTCPLSRSNTPGLVYCTFKEQCPPSSCTHAACIPSSALRRPPYAAQFASHIHPQAGRPRRAWFQSHKCLVCEVERLGLHLAALESLGRQQQQTAALPIPDLPVLPRQTCRCTLAAIPSRLAATCTHSSPIS